MEPENKSGLLEMLGSMHLSDKPRYGRIAGKITSPAQLGGKQAVDGPHHYSPGTPEYGKAVLDLAYPANSPVELRETQRSWPETGKEAGAEAAAGPFGS